MAYISPVLTLIVNAVKKASNSLTRDFNELEHLQNSVHADSSFAIRSYEKAAATLTEELAKAKPGYVVINSDKQSIPASGNCFLVSPIDGFVNFAHANSQFAVSVALIENNVPVDAVVYNPINDEMFFAEKGCGAFKEGFRNSERLRVAGYKNAEKGVYAINSAVEDVAKLFAVSSNIRISATTALDMAYLAAGKLDAVVAGNSSSVAVAAGMLLVKEAGGYIIALGETDVRSEDLAQVLISGNLLATNEALRQKIAVAMAK